VATNASPARAAGDRTIRRRLKEWAEAGLGQELLRIALVAFDQMIGLDLDDFSVDGSITKSPCGGEVSGRSPVDRGTQGTKRSVACDGDGIGLHLVAASVGRRARQPRRLLCGSGAKRRPSRPEPTTFAVQHQANQQVAAAAAVGTPTAAPSLPEVLT